MLNQWLLSLFNKKTFEALAQHLKHPELEGLNEDNNHRFLSVMIGVVESLDLPADALRGYDQNIVRHTQRLNEGRQQQSIRWKYFQWLTLLFTEVYLDRFLRDPDKLLADLNEFIAVFNADKSEKDKLPNYEPDDLRKLAFWNATGSGKTLLMHVNILQYQHYLELHGRSDELNRIILLTPNEGLSRQHLKEFNDAGLDADLFKKDTASLFGGKTIEIIEITKLREEMGEKSVAIDAFEGNNLVLVDEGHRGASSREAGQWMEARRRLCEVGFSFEYSATFGQAMKGAGKLEQEYAKCILFDYSYKFFYRDGFGKDYRILNLKDDSDDEQRRLYLTACLLAFYQQLKLHEDKPAEFRSFLIEKPLWVFVGGSVNAVRSDNKRKVSDVVDILLFLSEFVKDRKGTVKLLDRLLKGKSGLQDTHGKELFATAFGYLGACQLNGETAFADILKVLFNASAAAKLHIENLKGTDGEIALRLGENEAFGVINVGDTAALCKLCEEHTDALTVEEKEFSGSLFEGLNKPDSTVNVLIGSKKFTEGWNSWRVSTMGLMNVGKSEGSEIIQLFGRGVRLKGHGWCLKRSSQLAGVTKPQHIALLETLNIFGVRAQYMQQFKEYLEEEGLPTNEDTIEFVLPVVKNLDGGKKLKSIRVKEGKDYKRDGKKPTLDEPNDAILRHPVALNWYPKIQSQQSKGAAQTADVAKPEEGRFEDRHLAFMDIDAIYFELQRFKNERAWFNLNMPREVVPKLLKRSDWYKLYIPSAEMQFTRFDRVRRWEEIAVALLKKYIDRFYKHSKQGWEADHLEYHELREDDANFVNEYHFYVDQSQDAIVAKLKELKELIDKKKFKADFEFHQLYAIYFGQHLYQPLLHLKSDLVSVSPVSLNEGERDFVLDLRKYHETKTDFFAKRELYLLRNVSKRGIGFFEAGNFYPDFILWLVEGKKQWVTFVDPKGLRQLDEGSSNPKIQFYKTIKEIQKRLGNSNVILNSFIVSSTPYKGIPMWGDGLSKEKLRECHVLFQKDDKDTYIDTLLTTVAADNG